MRFIFVYGGPVSVFLSCGCSGFPFPVLYVLLACELRAGECIAEQGVWFPSVFLADSGAFFCARLFLVLRKKSFCVAQGNEGVCQMNSACFMCQTETWAERWLDDVSACKSLSVKRLCRKLKDEGSFLKNSCRAWYFSVWGRRQRGGKIGWKNASFPGYAVRMCLRSFF